MTKAVGIIAEYNPFHKGHKYHLEEALRMTGADVGVVCMSGNFVERGEPAILDKWLRAEMAVRSGANLVVELPTAFVTTGAGNFAKAGVEILENLGCESLAFGCETEDSELLSKLADFVSEHGDELDEMIRKKVKDGLSYPKAREEAILELAGGGDALSVLGEESEKLREILSGPNNNLALEYMLRLGDSRGHEETDGDSGCMTRMNPVPIKRIGGAYNSQVFEEGENASATAIRYLLEERIPVDELVPQPTLEILNKHISDMASSELLFKPLVQKVLTSTEEELNSAFGAEEGLGSILKRDVREWMGMSDVINSLKSKRYTRTRINRVIVNTLLDVKREAVNSAQNYIRVLAFDEKGAQYLKEVKKAGISKLPIITNINKEVGKNPEFGYALEKDILASDLYNLITGRDLYENSDYVRMPFRK